MTAAEARLWRRVQDRARRLQPDVSRAVLRAWRDIRARLSERQMATLLESGAFERVFAGVLSDASLGALFRPVAQATRDVVREGGALAVRNDLPRYALPPGGTVTVAFDLLNPRVVDAVRTLETRVITTLAADVRQTVREAVAAGMEAGQTPSTVARGLRDVIGLPPNAARDVRNYEAALRGAEGRSVTAYRMRNRTVDRLLARGPLSEAQVARYTEAYRTERLALNAETVSGTATREAMKLGQRLTWADAIDRGAIDGGNLMRTWVGVMDDRERDDHMAMEGVTVAFDEPYRMPDGALEMYPGEGEYNCRCIERVFVARTAVAEV